MQMAVRVADIPDSLLNEIDSTLQYYFLPIVGRDDDRATAPLYQLIGSGILVRIGSGYHIMTAGHVWDATKRFPVVGLILGSPRSCSPIPRKLITAHTLPGIESEAYGPDLALLAIPPPFVSQILAHKSALNLTQQRREFLAEPSHPSSGLWAITGMVESVSKVQHHVEERTIGVRIHVHSFFGSIDEAFERGGYDYLDAGVDTKLPHVPRSFGGVSGGPLWQIILSGGRTGELSWGGKKRFCGVAFWESPIQGERRVIRCHGRESIFLRAWEAWGLGNE